MRCYYEVLGIERTADDDDIKKAYRKLALVWHPDKNPDRIDECTSQFTQIQQAYDVLIDPQERAWYDRHRDQILKKAVSEEFRDDSINLFEYFTASCYVGYTDEKEGFYAVYREVFQTIADQDRPFIVDQDQPAYPSFGSSDSDYNEVVGPFYAFWQSYSTVKTYAWLEPYDIRQAQNRQVLRLMEKDNKKISDNAKRERNDEVRMLVRFVRKRDKRVLAYRRLLEERRQAQAKRVNEHSVKQRKQNEQVLKDYLTLNWNTEEHEKALQDIEAQLDEEFPAYSVAANAVTNSDSANVAEEGGSSQSEDENNDNDLFCVACEKAFKSQKAYQNHEQSKKHKENVAVLQQQMTEDELKLLRISKSDNLIEVPQAPRGKRSKRQKKRQQGGANDFDNENSEPDDCTPDALNSADLDLKPAPHSATASASVQNNNINSNSDEANVDGSVAEARPENVPPKPGRCSTCSLEFPSRTRLFEHLRESGHAALKVVQDSEGKAKKKGKQKQRK